VARYLTRGPHADFSWILTSRSEVPGVDLCEAVDLTDVQKLRQLLQRFQPDAIVNAAGEGSVDAVQARPEKFYPLNVEVPSILASYCRDREIPFIHISSNAVFGAAPPPYDDRAPYGPVNAYGDLKRQAELRVQSAYPAATILRPIQMYGWPQTGRRANLASGWIAKLRAREPIQVVDDVVSEPLWAGDAAETIRTLIKRPIGGPVNLSGGQALTLYEFAGLVAQEFNLDSALVGPVLTDHFTTLAPRPRDTRFSLLRLRNELGISPLEPRVGLAEMVAEERRNSFQDQDV